MSRSAFTRIALVACLLVPMPSLAEVHEVTVVLLPELLDDAGGQETVVAHPSEFVPDLVVIELGDTVRWIWRSGVHTVTSGDRDLCLADSLYAAPVDAAFPVFEHTFTETGLFWYFCDVHCDRAMYGAVAVQPPPATIAESWSRIKHRFVP